MRRICPCGRPIHQRKFQSYETCASCRRIEELAFRKRLKNDETDREMLLSKVRDEYTKLLQEKEEYEKHNQGFFSWLYRRVYCLRGEGRE